MFKNLKLILSLIVLFIVIFYVIDILNRMISFHNHPLKFEFLLTMIFFALSALLMTATCKIIQKKEIENIKHQFVTFISQELRAPLTSISGALKIISSELVGKIPPPMKEMIFIANNNATKLLEFVNDLVNVEKFQSKYDLDSITEAPKDE